MISILLCDIDAERLMMMLQDAIFHVEDRISDSKDCGIAVCPFEYEILEKYRELALDIEYQVEAQKE